MSVCPLLSADLETLRLHPALVQAPGPTAPSPPWSTPEAPLPALGWSRNRPGGPWGPQCQKHSAHAVNYLEKNTTLALPELQPQLGHPPGPWGPRT